MIVGCYTIHLYCDNPEPSPEVRFHEGHDFAGQFSGRTEGACYAQARRQLWKLDLKNGKAYCPRCPRVK